MRKCMYREVGKAAPPPNPNPKQWASKSQPGAPTHTGPSPGQLPAGPVL